MSKLTKKFTPEQTAVKLDLEDLIIKTKKDKSECFESLCFSLICKLPIDEIEREDNIGGNDERGFDIIHIDELNHRKIVSFLNCKSSEADDFSPTDIIKIKDGLNVILESTRESYSRLKNFKLKKKINDIRSDKESIEEMNIYYCVFRGENISDSLLNEVEEIKKYYKKFFESQYPNATFNFNFIGSTELIKYKTENNNSLKGETIEIPYYLERERPVVSNSSISGYIVTIKADFIAGLITEHGNKLFEKNVRGWMSFKKNNKEIYSSCVGDESEFFWFLNNGITIVCDEAIADDDTKKLKVKNLQIINGQQTAWSFYEAKKNNILKSDAKVISRIFVTNDPAFINKIAKATNTQTSIGGRDLMSNDSIQVSIESFFEKKGYNYERQSGRYKEVNNKLLKVNSKKIAQVSLAILCERPSLARKNSEDIFFNESKYYNEIFKRDPRELLFAYKLFKYCEDFSNKIKIKESDEKLIEINYFGQLHISRIIWNGFKKDFYKNIDSFLSKIDKGLLDIDSNYKNALMILLKIVKDNEKDIVSIGHYLNRIEVDKYINKELHLYL
jgi:hypothetical protein